MKRLGLIGNPIEHSLSPALFKEKFGGNNPDYSYDLILKDNFEEAAAVFKKDYYAANVTMPFKEKAYKYVGGLDMNATLAMAVNLMVNADKYMTLGYNTDVAAVQSMLRDIKKETGYEFLRVCIIGLGGAGRAAAVAAPNRKDEVYICNRTKKNISRFKKNIIKEEYNYIGFIIETCVLGKVKKMTKSLKDADVIVYALPHVETENNSPIIPEDIDLKGKWIIEPNYKDPIFSEEDAQVRGYHYISGKTWLRLQAEETYNIIMNK